jgi:mono/diheme cytochrome c family protein
MTYTLQKFNLNLFFGKKQMKTQQLLIIISSLFILNSCSKDYSPSEKSTGESMYQTACVQCHKKDDNGIIFAFDPENANVTYITERVKNGSLMMPKFPNIKDDQLKKLSDYVLKNSTNTK